MKMKNLAAMILSGCLTVTALSSLCSASVKTELIPGYGSITYGFENRFIGISQKRFRSSATGEMDIISCSVKQTNGFTYTCGIGSSFTTDWIPSNLYKSATVKYAHRMLNADGTYTYHYFLTRNCW